FPLRGAILASLGATQADPPAAVRERLAGVAAAPDWEGRRHEPYLQLLMAVEDEATVAETRTLDGGVLERRITEAVAAPVTRVAADRARVRGHALGRPRDGRDARRARRAHRQAAPHGRRGDAPRPRRAQLRPARRGHPSPRGEAPAPRPDPARRGELARPPRA